MSRADHNARPLRLCLTGGWFSSHNAGDNAILDGIRDAFSRRTPTEVTVLSSSPETVRALHDLPAFAPRRSPLAVLRQPMVNDALLFTGGTPFYDDPAHMAYFAALATAARMAGKPVAVFGISLRTLDKPLARALTRSIARQAAYLSGREVTTVERLEALAGGHGAARLMPDPATQLQPASADWAASELAALGVRAERPALGICLRDFTSPAKFRASHYTRGYTRAEVDNLLASVHALCIHAVEQHGMEIVFLPMNTTEPDDDRVPARSIASALADSPARAHVHVLEHQYGAREIKSLLGAMHAVVGVRFHSLVLANAMAVPTYAIGYAPKNEAIMQFFERAPWQQSVATLEGGKLLADLDAVLADHTGHAQALRVRNAAIDTLVDEEMRLVLRLLGREPD